MDPKLEEYYLRFTSAGGDFPSCPRGEHCPAAKDSKAPMCMWGSEGPYIMKGARKARRFRWRCECGAVIDVVKYYDALNGKFRLTEL